jgi:hypothetical protein
MQNPGAETYLVQGAAANAMAISLILLGVILYERQAENVVTIMVILPIYIVFIVFVGIPGGIVGLGFWLAGFVLKRKLCLLTRAGVGIVAPILISLLLNLAFNPDPDWVDLLWPVIPLLIVILPASLMSGSRCEPIRAVLLGLRILPVTFLEIRIRHALNQW